jgi:hypothetical protein
MATTTLRQTYPRSRTPVDEEKYIDMHGASRRAVFWKARIPSSDLHLLVRTIKYSCSRSVLEDCLSGVKGVEWDLQLV